MALHGRFLVARLGRRLSGLAIHFNYWFYVWTNLVLKYADLRRADFALHGVGPDFDYGKLVNDTDGENAPAPRAAGDNKDAHQQRYTDRALRQLAETCAKA